ncbi:MAG: NAD(P)(+) transhydrogenase (Re/Si-specific) subunit beta, partial [Bryobacteraceae bacterium]
MTEQVWQFAYVIAALAMVLSIKWLNSPLTARRGVLVGEVGMLLAIIGTLLRHEVINFEWIFICFAIGAAIGVPLAYLMPMTAVPQLTALSHAFGAVAAALVGTAEYYRYIAEGRPMTGFTMVALVVETVLGYLTFTASLMAFGKLQELIPTRPQTYKGQNFVNLALLAFAITLGGWMILEPTPAWVFPVFIGLSLLFGVLLIMPIGGGDMPTVIALLNSYAGASCAAMGFALENRLLVIAGSLNAASGFILSVIMCKAMNRSFANVLFGAFGQVAEGSAAQVSTRPVHSATAEDAAAIISSSRKVIIVPGYG